MGNPNHETTSPRAIETALRRATGPDPTTWQRIRSELFDRADTEGLIDVAFEHHDSPLGAILIGATKTGLVRIGLPAEDPDAVLDELAHRVAPRVLRGPRDSVVRARRQLDEYFDGTRHAFELALDWRLTRGFRLHVLHATAQIPYGTTASYRQIATQAGSPAAVRAAGTALALNPLPIVVPCHRVLRSGGGLGGYTGGLDRKRRLLAVEGL